MLSYSRRELLLGVGAVAAILSLEACGTVPVIATATATPTRIRPQPAPEKASVQELLFKTGAKQGIRGTDTIQLQPAERTPITAEYVEFYSNGAVLNTDVRLGITADPNLLNALVAEEDGGLKFPSNFLIATIITPLTSTQTNINVLMSSIPPSLERKLQAMFSKQITDGKYNINFVSTQEAMNAVLTPMLQQGNREIDLRDIAKRLSVQLSTVWFLSSREQYASANTLPTPARIIPPKIGELIKLNPPIKVVSITG